MIRHTWHPTIFSSSTPEMVLSTFENSRPYSGPWEKMWRNELFPLFNHLISQTIFIDIGMCHFHHHYSNSKVFVATVVLYHLPSTKWTPFNGTSRVMIFTNRNTAGRTLFKYF